MSGRAISRLQSLSHVLTASVQTTAGAATSSSTASTIPLSAAAAAADAAAVFGPSQCVHATRQALRSYCRTAALPVGALPVPGAPGASLGHGLLGLTRPGGAVGPVPPSVLSARTPWGVRFLSNRPAATGAEADSAAATTAAPAAAATAGPEVPPRETLVKQEARAIGGETAAAAGGTCIDPTATQAPSQPQGQPQQPHGDGWDGEEPPPVPLDPNAEVPGVLFVTAGAAISALIAVCIAALGILGTFYAGWVINSINKELQATTAAAEKPRPAGAAPGSAAAAAAAGASTPAAATVEATGPASQTTTKTEMVAKQEQEPAQAPAAAAVRPPPLAPPTAKRSWWSWLRLSGWRKQRDEGDDATRPSPA